jgi:hypothetical protein
VESSEREDLQRQVDELVALVASNTKDIDALEVRADSANDRADTSEERVDVLYERVDAVEAREVVDREMIAELQSQGVVSRQHVAQLEQALVSSRIIGAAIGILMDSRKVSQDDAFTMLKQASFRSNRKIRDIAAAIVHGANTMAQT